MKEFTGWQYLLIDLANAFGKDKLRFEERIQWAEDNLAHLESLVSQAEKPALYYKAMLAVRKAQAGKPTGHLVEFDGVCSGIQIMAALTGCIDGARATGMVDPDRRADAYTDLTNAMNDILRSQGIVVKIPREDAKRALMTSFYGSREIPKELFGEDTPQINAFYKAAQYIAPGPWELLQDLVGSWQPYALEHAWTLPDGYEAKVKVMEKVSTRIEVDELDHATFTYEYYENVGSKKGLSNAANVIHSIDAYVLRNIHRRCNYDLNQATEVQHLLTSVVDHLNVSGLPQTNELQKFIDRYEEHGIVDTACLGLINPSNIMQLPQWMGKDLLKVLDMMLAHKPFPVVTIHDAFKCHANHMNHLRKHYREILAQLAESEVISSIIGQIMNTKGTWVKKSNTLADRIRASNYALC